MMRKEFNVRSLLNKLREEPIHTWFDLGLFLDRVKEGRTLPSFCFEGKYDDFKTHLHKGGIAFITYHYMVDGVTVEVEKYAELASQTNSSKAPSSFRLWLGISTGKLVDLWQKTGMSKNQHVSLDLEDACQNIIVLGGIGSGKTTCVMQPLLLQCLDQECGGLIFDIKGDVKHAVAEISSATGRKLVIEAGQCKAGL